MSVIYAPPIAETRIETVPEYTLCRSMTSGGYTKQSGAPTDYKIRLSGETRWRRVYVYCISNSGTLFIKLPGNPFAVISDDPREYLPK
jgi:hypothetical protein